MLTGDLFITEIGQITCFNCRHKKVDPKNKKLENALFIKTIKMFKNVE